MDFSSDSESDSGSSDCEQTPGQLVQRLKDFFVAVGEAGDPASTPIDADIRQLGEDEEAEAEAETAPGTNQCVQLVFGVGVFDTGVEPSKEDVRRLGLLEVEAPKSHSPD
ncbi:MAG: uncharacterized protein KVP18_000863 [Porospora cf. gigantea A]|uniref:uncharacterized protein n=1 Tax=Porospora cf. gigantea A TaxID=2853593 RepID=UPI003559C5B5|nr:MAG: hypothetical protein KVP18_000863 [Porospora cf. gigantea A]